MEPQTKEDTAKPSKPSVMEPLLQEILAETFALISFSDRFDTSTVDRLKVVASRGDLKKAAQVIQALKSPLGD